MTERREGLCRWCGGVWDLDEDGDLEEHVNTMTARRCYGSEKPPSERLDG